jgi:hypothetical protein
MGGGGEGGELFCCCMGVKGVSLMAYIKFQR